MAMAGPRACYTHEVTAMSLAHNHHHHAHGDLTNRAAIASVTMALFLLALKIFAAAETGSGVSAHFNQRPLCRDARR